MTGQITLPKDVQTMLARCTNLPSPPAIAAKIIDISTDPTADLSSVTDAVSKDPALAAKILRIANSPLYSRQRKIDNLRQAIGLFGIDGTLNIALSFSLKRDDDSEEENGLNLDVFWKRSLAAAMLAQQIGFELGTGYESTLFLTGLTQDIGMLALDKALPDLYTGISSSLNDHSILAEYEKAHLGCDHAVVSAWLLNQWNLPTTIVEPICYSHCHETNLKTCVYTSLCRCLAASSILADIFINKQLDYCVNDKIQATVEIVQLSKETIASALATTTQYFQDTAELFDINVQDTTMLGCILEQAKEALVIRNLKAMQHSRYLQQTANELEEKTSQLEERSRCDGLTHVYNRKYMDEILKEEFSNAKNNNWPLAVIFIDIDHFKSVNDTYGHQTGDQILTSTARLICHSLRETDIIARYGGEEFLAILPGVGVEAAAIACNRIHQAFLKHEETLGDGQVIRNTVSKGAAVMNQEYLFEDYEELVRAADNMCYQSKRNGRNQYHIYNEQNKSDPLSSVEAS